MESGAEKFGCIELNVNETGRGKVIIDGLDISHMVESFCVLSKNGKGNRLSLRLKNFTLEMLENESEERNSFTIDDPREIHIPVDGNVKITDPVHFDLENKCKKCNTIGSMALVSKLFDDDEELFYVKCYACNHESLLGTTEKLAVEKWENGEIWIPKGAPSGITEKDQ